VVVPNTPQRVVVPRIQTRIVHVPVPVAAKPKPTQKRATRARPAAKPVVRAAPRVVSGEPRQALRLTAFSATSGLGRMTLLLSAAGLAGAALASSGIAFAVGKELRVL
jgi:hypothetical protein